MISTMFVDNPVHKSRKQPPTPVFRTVRSDLPEIKARRLSD